MRRVIVNDFVSLDGVAQVPGGADEDTSRGFEDGGWHLRYFDDLSQKQVLDNDVEASTSSGDDRPPRPGRRKAPLPGSQAMTTGAILATHARAGG